jgi:hypothetical protein
MNRANRPRLARIVGSSYASRLFGRAGDGSTLNLDFTTGEFDSRLTLTRSGSATFINSAGQVQTASANTPRFDYDPVSGTLNGLLIEASATNLLNWSETFATAGGTNNNWADLNITRNSTNNTSPRNDATALRVTASSGNGTIISSAAIGTSAQRTFSIWLRRVSGTGNIQYTLDNGSTYTTQAITSSWVRYTFAATTAAQRVGIRIVTSGDSIELWGAMLETSSGATSYVVSAGTQGTRDSDKCWMDNPGFSAFYTQGIGTALFVGRHNLIVGTPHMVNFSTGTNAPRVLMYNTGSVAIYSENSGVNASFTATGTITTSTVYKTAIAFETGQYRAVLNGGTVASGGSSTPPMASALTRLNIGMSEVQTAQINGWVRQVKYWPARLSDSNLRAITT